MPLQLSLDPINYSALQTNADPGSSFLQGLQDAHAQALQQAQLHRQLQQQQQLDAARQAAITNPSVENYNRLLVLDPQSHEAIKAAHDSMDADQQKTSINDLSAVRGYLRAGRPEDAQRLIQRRIDADKKAGHDTADDEQMLGLISDDPDGAAGLVDYQLAGVMGPEKWGEAFGKIGEDRRADTQLPAQIAKTTAEAAQASATATKTGEEAKQVAPNAVVGRQVDQARIADLNSQIATRADQLNLDRDKLQTNTQLELEKLQGKGVPLSATSEQVMNSAVVNAESSRQLASRASDLADKIQGATLSGGWGSWLAQNAQGAFGNPNLLRKEYQTLINSQAVKNLPPGPASDKDIAMAKQGFPPPTANAETMSSFLRGMAKLQTISANREQARADWISDNGNLGRARHDLTVNGVKVPAGATFADFSASAAAGERREAVGDRSYMRFGNGGR